MRLQSSNNTSVPDNSCGPPGTSTGSLELRIASIFVILVTSLFGTLFPIVSRRVKRLGVPEKVYQFAKYFGSGVIIATAFIHLLGPGFQELNAPCLPDVFANYAFAPAISMMAVFVIFVVELVAHRSGAAYLKRKGLKSHDVHSLEGGNEVGHTTHGAHVSTRGRGLAAMEEGQAGGKIIVDGQGEGEREADNGAGEVEEEIRQEPVLNREDSGSGTSGTATESQLETGQETKLTSTKSHGHQHQNLQCRSRTSEQAQNEFMHHHPDYHDDAQIDESAMAQILAVAILEFGVVVHSLIIGLTLAVKDEFITLFVVLIFHQMFEGLGLGSRLSTLPLPSRLNYVPYVGAVFYSCITPLGVAIGLGVRNTYNPNSEIANLVSGVLDSTSSGILLYTGLVELLAHDFIFNRKMVDASNFEVTFSLGCVLLGAGIMALLGRWA